MTLEALTGPRKTERQDSRSTEEYARENNRGAANARSATRWAYLPTGKIHPYLAKGVELGEERRLMG
jgi:hypothetical protein